MSNGVLHIEALSVARGRHTVLSDVSSTSRPVR